MLVLYLLDVSYWEGVALVWLRRVCLSVTGVILLLGATMATGDMPYAPIILFLLLMPLYWQLLLKKLKTQLAAYLISLSVVQLILAVGGMAAWAIWVFTGNSWEASKGKFIFQMGCCLDATGGPLLNTNATEAGGRGSR